MLQLMSPAGSPEAVIAAVQSGADFIHIGHGLTVSDKPGESFSADQMKNSLRYCRVRGCKTVYSIPSPLSDEGIAAACQKALFAAENGADAIMLQDIGLVRVLRSLLPDMPLWGDVRMGISDIDGVLAAAALGLSRVTLAPELSLDEIAAICSAAPIETIVYVHGHLCFSRAGQCYIGAFSDADTAAGRTGWCSDICRQRFDLGGRMDDYPLSMKDLCLLDHISELSDAGVTCVAIEGHNRSPEYAAFATTLYSRAIRDHVPPTAQERQELEEYFSTGGITDAYLRGDREADMFGLPRPAGRDARKAQTEIRRRYMSGELRRVPLKFYAVIQPGKPALFAAEDDRGNRAVTEGYEPVDLGRRGIGEARVREILYRTGGTPYACAEVKCSVDARMDYPDEAVEAARRELIAQISEQARNPKPINRGDMPAPPHTVSQIDKPKLICQVSREIQLSEDLASCEPDFLYVPAELIAAGSDGLKPFYERSIPLVAVLPRVADQKQAEANLSLIQAVREHGVTQLLGGSLAWLHPARALGMQLRGDYALNIANGYALDTLADARLLSATVSFELSMTQITAMPKPIDTEMIVYGRMPVMLSDQCIMRRSAGRCSCDKPVMMHDQNGRQYPVLKESDCRNIIYDSDKIFLADRINRCYEAGLWGLRLLFSSESAKECVEVMRRYKFRGDYTPNDISRGLYAKGAL